MTENIIYMLKKILIRQAAKYKNKTVSVNNNMLKIIFVLL